MPRLLLVDDNPSIHRIAETLLAASDIQLVSCGSGAEAMTLIERGDPFDVALLDTSMAGMDGWALLERIRDHAATARIPVAMMAGVLDLVDPEKVKNAPIQGFLKKPVELRDLGDRVRRLLEAPVPPPAPRPAPAAEAFLTHPGLRIPDLLAAAAEDDLLLLGPEDLFAEAEAPQDQPDGSATLEIPPAPEAGAPAEPEGEPLDLEELDLEGLRGLSFPPPELSVEAPAVQPPPAAMARPDLEAEAGFTIPEFLLADTLPETGPDLGWDNPEYPGILPDLGPGAAARPAAEAPLASDEFFDWSDESDSLVGLADSVAPAGPPASGLDDRPEVLTLSDILDPPVPRLGFVTPASLHLEEVDLDALPTPPRVAVALAEEPNWLLSRSWETRRRSSTSLRACENSKGVTP